MHSVVKGRMKHICLLLATVILLFACKLPQHAAKSSGFELRYTAQEKQAIADYLAVLKAGKRQTESFFGKPFPNTFTVTIHPNRSALDSCWQQDWKMPDFHSECWMVASGIATKLDLLSPKVWSQSACEHNWEDRIASARLIAHEMIHVYHGQHNASPDFNDVDRIDWFVEGLAVYASGQCDSTRMAGLRGWLKDHPAPGSLDQFWSGPQKYGLSGSVVMYLDQKLGREKLCSLLVFNKKEDLLKAVGMTEGDILEGWRVLVMANG